MKHQAVDLPGDWCPRIIFGLLLVVVAPTAWANTLQYTFDFQLEPGGEELLDGIPLPAKGDPFRIVLDVSTVRSGEAFGSPTFKIKHFLVSGERFLFEGDDPAFGFVAVNDTEAGTAFVVNGRFGAVGRIDGHEVRFGVFTALSRILLLEDLSGMALTEGRLPRAIDLDDFERIDVGIFMLTPVDSASIFTFSGRLVSATVIPEPDTGSLFVCGLLGTLGLAWLRGRTPHGCWASRRRRES